MITEDVAAPAESIPRQHLIARLVYPQSRIQRLLQWILIASAVALGLASLRTPLAQLSPPNSYAKDFLQPYLLGRAIRDGVNPYLPIQTLAEQYLDPLPFRIFPHPTPHPPPLGILLLPLSFLDYNTASVVWFGLEIVFMAAGVSMLARTQGARLSPVATILLTVALFIWFPFEQDLYWGQLVSLQLLMLVGSRLALREERPVLCGALLGLAILIKPTPWPLVIVFLLRRHWRAVSSTAATTLLGYLASVYVLGFDTLLNYLTVVLPQVSEAYRAQWSNWSTWTIGWRLFDGTTSGPLTGILTSITAPPLVKCVPAAAVASIALPGLVLAAGTAVAHRARSLDVALGVMLCVSLFISPVSWSHYIQLLCLPIAWVIGWLVRHRFPVGETNASLVTTGLLFLSLDGLWGTLAYSVAGRPPLVAVGQYVLPFAPTLLTLGPGLAVALLGWLLARIEASSLNEARYTATCERSCCRHGA